MTHIRRQALMDQAIAERERLREWLLPYMADGKPKAFTKEDGVDPCLVPFRRRTLGFDG